MKIKTVAIIQSSYIPWKGYFDIINSVDEFILYDEVQFTRRDWRNRNRIKTALGTAWLTIPVEVKGRYHQSINETVIADLAWPRKHAETMRHSYVRAQHFKDYGPLLFDLYSHCTFRYLSEINRYFIEAICRVLGIDTKISSSIDYDQIGGSRTARLVQLCKRAGASLYLSGPSAAAYLDEALFAEAGIAVTYADYSGYPEYPQLFPPFDHRVSIVDLLLNAGPRATHFMKSFA